MNIGRPEKNLRAASWIGQGKMNITCKHGLRIHKAGWHLCGLYISVASTCIPIFAANQRQGVQVTKINWCIFLISEAFLYQTNIRWIMAKLAERSKYLPKRVQIIGMENKDLLSLFIHAIQIQTGGWAENQIPLFVKSKLKTEKVVGFFPIVFPWQIDHWAYSIGMKFTRIGVIL